MRTTVLLLSLALGGCSPAFWAAFGDGLSAAGNSRAQSASNDNAPAPQNTQCQRVGDSFSCTTYGAGAPRTTLCREVGGTFQCSSY